MFHGPQLNNTKLGQMTNRHKVFLVPCLTLKWPVKLTTYSEYIFLNTLLIISHNLYFKCKKGKNTTHTITYNVNNIFYVLCIQNIPSDSIIFALVLVSIW